MVMSARLWSESGFSAYQLRREMIVGAGLGALLVLSIYNLVVFLITRAPNYAWLSALLLLITFWQIIGHGYADLVLWPDAPWVTGRTLPAVMPLCLAALLQFSRGFLVLDPASRIGRAIHIYLFACLGAATLLICWPEPSLFMPLSVSLTPSLLLLLGYAVSKLRSGDANARRFVVERPA